MIEPKLDEKGNPIPLSREEKLANVEEMAGKGMISKTAAPGKVSAYDTLKKNLSGK